MTMKQAKAAMLVRIAGLALAAMLLACPAAHAQGAVADFYKGKTITIIAASSPGGGIDLFARWLARFMPRHVPGNPTMVVANMPGAGTKVAAKHIYNVAPKDGTVMGTVLSGALFDPIRVEAAKRDYDPLQYNYIGNGNAEALTTVVRTASKVKSLDDMLTTEMITGTPGGGSSVHESTLVTKNLLGAKLKVVTGYPGVKEIALAMDRGEVDGMIGLAFSTARTFFKDYLTGAGGVKVIAQNNLGGHPELNKAGVPLSISMVKNEADRKALEVYQAQAVLVRVYIMPPGVPAERVEAVRKAFLDAINSAELQAEVQKANSEAVPMSGAELTEQIKKMYATPKEIVDRIAKAVTN